MNLIYKLSYMKVLHLANVIGDNKGGGVNEVVSNLYKNQKRLP